MTMRLSDSPRGLGGAGRRAIALVAAIVPLAALLLGAVVLAPRLGDSMASHWSADLSRPDGFSSTWGSFWAFASITAALTIVSVVTILLTHRRAVSRTWPAISALTAGILAVAWLASAWATADAPEPSEASLGARLLLLVVAVVIAVPLYLLLPPTRPVLDESASGPTLTIDAGERVVWTGLASSGILGVVVLFLALLFVGSVVVAIITETSQLWITAVVFFVAGAASSFLVPARLTIDRRGVRLASALFGVPLIRVRLEAIEKVATGDIIPSQWGGWGYRLSGAGVAYVGRRGPGLIITRRGGSAVAITVNDAEQACAVATALVAQGSTSGTP